MDKMVVGPDGDWAPPGTAGHCWAVGEIETVAGLKPSLSRRM